MTLTFSAEPVVAAECEVRDHVLVMDDAIRGTLGGVLSTENRVTGGGGGGGFELLKKIFEKCTKGGEYRILSHRNCMRTKNCMHNTTRILGTKKRQRNETEPNRNRRNQVNRNTLLHLAALLAVNPSTDSP